MSYFVDCMIALSLVSNDLVVSVVAQGTDNGYFLRSNG